MKQLFVNYFALSRSDRNGIMLLLLILCVLLFLPHFYTYIFSSQQTIDSTSRFMSDIQMYKSSIKQQLALADIERKARYEKKHIAKNTIPKAASSSKPMPKVTLRHFNPNTLSIEQSLSLGLSKKVANTINNYLAKGYKFYKKEDLKKIYGLSNSEYNRIESYIKLPKQQNNFSKPATQQAVAKVAESAPKSTAVLFNFDPNTLTYEQALQLGLSRKAAKNLRKYVDKGGTFSHKAAIKKVYGISESDYQRLAPYITLAPKKAISALEKQHANTGTKSFDATPPSPAVQKNTYSPKKNIQVDINTATITEWKQLYGIGPSYSKRIIKYRELLGGFTQKEQLKEVYGFSDSLYQQIAPHLVNNNTQNIQQINLNQADAKTLASHPYINWTLAKIIVSYREQHGVFKQTQALAPIHAIDEDLLTKISPYLKIE